MSESAWHKDIKSWGVEDELLIGRRRSDCLLRCGKRAEVQARGFPPEEVTAREAHTDLWILHGRAAHQKKRIVVWDDPRYGTLFRWDFAWPGFEAAKRQVFINLSLSLTSGAGTFLEVTRWTFEGRYPQKVRAFGTGTVHTADAMRNWMRYDIPLPTATTPV